MQTRKLLAGVLFIVLLTLGAAGAASQQDAPVRPRDPWVFRCVLDERPRMVVIALSDDLYVAYDATDCSLYKAWQGDVKFDGAVYTAVHGPQPTSRGHDYIVEPDQEPWLVRQGGKPRDYPTPRWLGYRFIQGQVHLRYSFEINDETVLVVEVPEVRMVGDGVAFVRTMRVHGLPETIFLGMSLPLYDTAGEALRYFIGGRPMHPKEGDPTRAVHLPISSRGDLEIVTYMPIGDRDGEGEDAADE